jgi:nitrate/nitrite transport system substrate-binding protein
MNPNSLRPAEKTQLNIGFMRLSDSAPLIIAQEQNFFERYGLDVTLNREVSWANVRDKVAVGTLDASQMLAPMPLVTAPGVKNMPGPFMTGLMLSLNGNAITLSSGLSKQLEVKANKTDDYRPDPVLAARQLGKIITSLPRQLTLATVYPYSMHTFQLRHWLLLGGICPDRDVNIIVLPPEQMVDNLARGIIDGFCVGEPWNTAAVQAGIGSSVVSGYQLWNNAPEKALVVARHWHDSYPSTHLRLRLAVMEATTWLSQQENREASVSILARQQYLDLPEHMISPALLGYFQYNKHNRAVKNQDFIVFHRYQAGFPWRSRAEYLLRKNVELQGKTITDSEVCQLTEKVYRADLYREAASLLGYSCPSTDYKTEGVHADPYLFEDAIELGPDLFLNGEETLSCQG